MKQIHSNSFKLSQNMNINVNPARVNAPRDNPQVKAFNAAFMNFNVDGLTSLSPADAATLATIQDKIRKKLRMFGVQVGF